MDRFHGISPLIVARFEARYLALLAAGHTASQAQAALAPALQAEGVAPEVFFVVLADLAGLEAARPAPTYAGPVAVALQPQPAPDAAALLAGAPLAGLTLPQFAHLAAALHRGDDRAEALAAAGLDEGGWARAKDRWEAALSADGSLALPRAYGDAFVAGLGDALHRLAPGVADT